MLSSPQTPQPFVIICGLRGMAEQIAAVSSGHSETLHSRHLPGGGLDNAQAYGGKSLAVDIACLNSNGALDWTVADDEGGMYGVAATQILNTASKLGIDVQWGGSEVGAWIDNQPSHYRDWGHFQLDPAKYP